MCSTVGFGSVFCVYEPEVRLEDELKPKKYCFEEKAFVGAKSLKSQRKVPSSHVCCNSCVFPWIQQKICSKQWPEVIEIRK